MTLSEKAKYANVGELKTLLASLPGKKFKLDCGHHITLGQFLGNDMVIFNGKEMKIICFNCAQ